MEHVAYRPIKILSVEDDLVDRMAFQRFVQKEGLPYEVTYASSVEEGRNALSTGSFEVVLLDFNLGDGTAFDLFENAKQFPIVIVTGQGDEAVAVQAMKTGAYDYLTKDREGRYLTTLPITLEKVLERRRMEMALRQHQEQLEKLVRERTAELADALLQLRKTLESTVDAISVMIENRDPYTFGHQRRVCELACAIAKRLGFSDDRILGLKMASLLHDIGKINVPAEILNRPGVLERPANDLLRRHPTTGYTILKAIEFPWPVAKAVQQHHERLDGSGYPDGLKGGEILLEARIIGVADVVESMASHRPYRPARGLQAALREVSDHRGSQFDSEVVDACLALFHEEGFCFTATDDPFAGQLST